MIDFRVSVTAGLFALVVAIAPAHGQQARSFVSGLGSDLNAPNCTRTAPCRTFQKAHDNTLPTGEITVLDPGSYGSVIINRNISIINDGVGEAGALVSGGGVGIAVDAGPNDRVSLRGLTIKGLDPAFGGSNGIKFNSGASLTVENCAIRNHSGDGIEMIGNVAANTTATFTLSNTIVADNGGNGIYVQPTGPGFMKVVLNRVEIYNNGAHGFAVSGLNTTTESCFFGCVQAAATDSVAAHNGLSGFVASDNATQLVLKRVVSWYNKGAAIQVSDGSSVLSETTSIQNNQAGLFCSPNLAGILTFGDNALDGVAGNCSKTSLSKY